ncbi:hypothetical protein [Paenibacillus ferrarius]|uniref:hypothetical protein n=1 Tax=Paenibacillus ferrarius TaxID=1469647 RepID=UPI00117F5E60|nr:hypothetical protein [Paenibacillus ferrarius]
MNREGIKTWMMDERRSGGHDWTMVTGRCRRKIVMDGHGQIETGELCVSKCENNPALARRKRNYGTLF